MVFLFSWCWLGVAADVEDVVKVEVCLVVVAFLDCLVQQVDCFVALGFCGVHFGSFCLVGHDSTVYPYTH